MCWQGGINVAESLAINEVFLTLILPSLHGPHLTNTMTYIYIYYLYTLLCGVVVVCLFQNNGFGILKAISCHRKEFVLNWKSKMWSLASDFPFRFPEVYHPQTNVIF